MKKNILFAAITVFLFFSLVEISLRFISFTKGDQAKVEFNKDGNPLFKAIPDDYLGYKMNPESSVPGMLEINSFGYRGKEVALIKPENTYRIVTLGGSSTAGYQVWPGFTYPAILEHFLRNNPPTPGLNYEVINGGIGGYTSIQAHRSLTRDLIRFEPDLVIWMSGWNDLMQSFIEKWNPGLLLQKKSKLSRFALYKVSKKLLERFSLIPRAKTQYKTFNQEALLHYKQNTENTIAFLKERNIAIWVLSLPVAYGPNDSADNHAFQIAFGNKKADDEEVKMTLSSYKSYLNVMKELSSEYNIPLVNSGISDGVTGKRYFFTDILHPNNSGNKVIAYNLYKHFIHRNNFFNDDDKSVFNDFWEAELLYGNIDNANNRNQYLLNLSIDLKGTAFNDKKSIATAICEFVINLIKVGGLDNPYILKHLIALLNTGIFLSPDYPLTYFVLGTILQDTQKKSEAGKLFSTLSLHDKEFNIKKAMNTRIQVEKSQKIDKKYFKDLIESFNSKELMETYFINLSTIFGKAKEYDLGIYYAEKALTNNPQSIEAKWNLTLNLFNSGQLERALLTGEDLHEKPNHPKQLSSLLKEIYLIRGFTEKAKILSDGKL